MVKWLRPVRFRLLWFACFAVLTAVLYIFRSNKQLMTAVAGIALRYKQGAAYVFSFLPFSVTELIIALAVLLALFFIVRTIVVFVRGRGARREWLIKRVTLAICVIITVFCLLFILLGASYYAESFEEKSGINARATTVDKLEAVTRSFAERLAASAAGVPRNADGVMEISVDAVFKNTASLYNGAQRIYPFLAAPRSLPKPMLLSRWFSHMGYTGFCFPFTGEANINTDQPACLLPATVSHEMAHQRGIAREQEANFVAILACLESGLPEYKYSGAMLGFIHLGNALYKYDPDAYSDIFLALPDTVIADIRHNNAYWKQFESEVSEASQAVYDTFLKSYGQELGIMSYGAVVDLLIAYYG